MIEVQNNLKAKLKTYRNEQANPNFNEAFSNLYIECLFFHTKALSFYQQTSWLVGTKKKKEKEENKSAIKVRFY